MKVYTPDHSLIHHTSIDISNRVNISKPVNLVQYDSLPIIKVDLYYGHERYTIPDGIDLVRLRMGRLPSQYYYKDILGWSSDKQSVYIQVEEDMTKDIGEFGLVIEFIEFDYESSKNKWIINISNKPYLGNGVYRYLNSNNQTIDYDIYKGSYIYNRPVTNSNQISLIGSQDVNGMYSIQFIYVSGYAERAILIRNLNDHNVKLRPIHNNVSIIGYDYINDKLDLYGNFIASTTYEDYTFQLQLEEGTEATEFEPPIKLMIAASSKVNVTVERNPVQEDHINKQETEVK